MKLLLITNLNHRASKQFVSYLKLKNINFDLIDCAKIKKIKILKKYDYLISFLNTIFITKNVRKKIRIDSFNFHPGPPEYPGFGCYNFALLDKVKFYGSTIHIINDKFDNGKIIDFHKFNIIYKRVNLEKLINLTHKNITKQAKKFIQDLLNKKFKIQKKIKWKRKAFTKKEFERAREIKLYDTRKDVLKKIKAFSYKNYDSVYIKYKGFKFELKKK